MGRIITAPGVLANVQGQINHALDLYQNIKDNNLKPITITLDPVTNANGAYTHTTTNNKIAEEMKPIALEVGTPEVFSAPIIVSTSDGSATITCSNAHGTSTITVTFVHTWPIDGGEDIPERVTSTEFDILADRIGALSTLDTIDKSSIVNAVNELEDGKAPTSHASVNTDYGTGNATNYGHVKISDIYNGTPNASAKAENSIAASQWALQTVYNELTQKLNMQVFQQGVTSISANTYKDLTFSYTLPVGATYLDSIPYLAGQSTSPDYANITCNRYSASSTETVVRVYAGNITENRAPGVRLVVLYKM